MTAVPRDDEAEAVVVGAAVSLHDAYTLAADRLGAGDLWVPSLRRLFEACAELGHLAGTDIDTEETRIATVARLAGVDLLEVRRLVEDRPVMRDRAGTYTARVLAASKARAVMSACAEVFNRLGAGEPLEDVLADTPAAALLLEEVA